MKDEQEPLREDEIRWQIEKERIEKSLPRQKGLRTLNIVSWLVVLAAILVGIWLSRARLGQLWQKITGREPPAAVEEPEEREGPMVPGKDF